MCIWQNRQLYKTLLSRATIKYSVGMDNIGRQNWDTQIVIIRYMILGPTLNMRGLIKILRFLILCVCYPCAKSWEASVGSNAI